MVGLKIAPPSPDEVFPHLDLDFYGSLQGDMEFGGMFIGDPSGQV